MQRGETSGQNVGVLLAGLTVPSVPGKLGLTSLLGSGVEPTFIPPELGHVSGLRRDVLLRSRVPSENVHVQPEVCLCAGPLVFTVCVKFYVYGQ